MKRLLVILFLIPSIAFGAFTEFYCQSGGSNLNAGSTTNNTAAYTSAGGNWTNSTRVFTVTDGTNPSSSVSVGDFASVYVTAGAVSTSFVGRVSNVQNATNGTITFDASSYSGTIPSNGSGTMTLKAGGAWKGPNGTDVFPYFTGKTHGWGSATDTNADEARINLKNDQTYSMTVTLFLDFGANFCVTQGYSSSVGDGGKATLSSNITSGTNFQFTAAALSGAVIDISFVNTGASGTNHLVALSNVCSDMTFVRCVFSGARGCGLFHGVTSGGTTRVIESEAYDCNKSNTANDGGFVAGQGALVCINDYSHDHASGSNAHGFGTSGTSACSLTLVNCISETNAGSGVNLQSTAGACLALNNNFYNNTGDGIKFSSLSGFTYIANNNFTKNSGKGVNASASTAQGGFLYNNGRGAGTEANGSSDTLASIYNTSTDITYAINVEPYTAPTTGNFSTNLPAAQRVGRSHFEENDGTNTGTVGYPDIGAAQAQIGTAFPTPTATPTVTPTSTPTPTATATVTPTVTPTPTAPIEQSYVYPN